MITADQVQVAKQAAVQASNEFFQKYLGGQDKGACGFGWVEVYVDRTNSRQAKELIAAGFRKDWKPKCLTMWDPGQVPCQNVDVKEAGAQAMAKVLQELGLRAYGCSRLD